MGPSVKSSAHDVLDYKTLPLKTVSSKCATKLYSLIKQKQWAEVISRVNAIPNEASVWIAQDDVRKPTPDGSGTSRPCVLPLHVICELHPTEAAVKSLLRAFPEAARVRDDDGNLPLHIACRERASAGVVNAILSLFPHGAGVNNLEGCLPIHLACRRWAEAETVSILLSVNPDAAREIDALGRTPLHRACANDASLSIIETLLRAHPTATAAKDKGGQSPHDLVASRPPTPSRDSLLERLSGRWTCAAPEAPKDAASSRAAAAKAESLEKRLADVTASSRAAAKSFSHFKDVLMAENGKLRKANASLMEVNGRQEERIEELNAENRQCRKELEDVSKKFERLAEIVRGMEEYRHMMLTVTGKWEKVLVEAEETTTIKNIPVEVMSGK